MHRFMFKESIGHGYSRPLQCDLMLKVWTASQGVPVVSNRWWVSFRLLSSIFFLNILRHPCEFIGVARGGLVYSLGNTILSDFPREIQRGRGRTRTDTWIFWLLTPLLPLNPLFDPFLYDHGSPATQTFHLNSDSSRENKPAPVFKTEEMWDRELHWRVKSWEATRTMSPPRYEHPCVYRDEGGVIRWKLDPGGDEATARDLSERRKWGRVGFLPSSRLCLFTSASIGQICLVAREQWDLGMAQCALAMVQRMEGRAGNGPEEIGSWLALQNVVYMLRSIVPVATIYWEPTIGVRDPASSWGYHNEQHGPDQRRSNIGEIEWTHDRWITKCVELQSAVSQTAMQETMTVLTASDLGERNVLCRFKSGKWLFRCACRKLVLRKEQNIYI